MSDPTPMSDDRLEEIREYLAEGDCDCPQACELGLIAEELVNEVDRRRTETDLARIILKNIPHPTDVGESMEDLLDHQLAVLNRLVGEAQEVTPDE